MGCIGQISVSFIYYFFLFNIESRKMRKGAEPRQGIINKINQDIN